MKKAATVSSSLLLALMILFPAAVFGFGHLGYMFEPASCFALALITAILSVCTVVVSFQTEDAIQSKVIRVLLAVITPVSLINALFYITECNTAGVFISVFISAGCCCLLTVEYGKPLVLKIIALILSAFMALPVCLTGCIGSFLMQDTVVQTVESPDGKYYAEVTVNDQGALGGNTYVDVHEKSEINCILFKLEKWPQNVYRSNWTAHINMEIYWKDEQCLVIDSVEYAIE